MNEFTHSKVPDNETVSGWRIALVKIGIVIALPSFLTGAEIGFQLGLVKGGIAIAIGCLVLMILCSLTATVAAKSRLPTAMITQFAFGRTGAKLVNLVIALTLIGWFAVTLELFAGTLQKIVGDFWQVDSSRIPFIFLGGILMFLTTLYGFKALSKLANFAVPLMFSVLLVMAYVACSEHLFSELLAFEGNGVSLGLVISAIVGAPSTGTIIFPDIARFARSANHGRGAAALSYGFGMPSIFILTAITAVATNEKDLILIMAGLGLGIPAFLFLTFTAWTTNSGNLYSGSLGLSGFLTTWSHSRLVVLGGMVGIGLALFGITNYFIPFLILLGITIPPIGGIYVTDFFLRGQKLDPASLASGPAIGVPAFVAWGLGTTIAFLSAKEVLSLTGVSACDAMLVSAVSFLLMKKMNVLLSGNT